MSNIEIKIGADPDDRGLLHGTADWNGVSAKLEIGCQPDGSCIVFADGEHVGTVSADSREDLIEGIAELVVHGGQPVASRRINPLAAIFVAILSLVYMVGCVYVAMEAFSAGGWPASAGMILFFISAPAVIYGLRRRQLEDEHDPRRQA
jgi:hypothetical protein